MSLASHRHLFCVVLVKSRLPFLGSEANVNVKKGRSLWLCYIADVFWVVARCVVYCLQHITPQRDMSFASWIESLRACNRERGWERTIGIHFMTTGVVCKPFGALIIVLS